MENPHADKALINTHGAPGDGQWYSAECGWCGWLSGTFNTREEAIDAADKHSQYPEGMPEERFRELVDAFADIYSLPLERARDMLYNALVGEFEPVRDIRELDDADCPGAQ